MSKRQITHSFNFNRTGNTSGPTLEECLQISNFKNFFFFQPVFACVAGAESENPVIDLE